MLTYSTWLVQDSNSSTVAHKSRTNAVLLLETMLNDFGLEVDSLKEIVLENENFDLA